MQYENSLEFAQQLDREDPLARYQDQFLFPNRDGEKVIYFCGNSLGLQPKTVQHHIQKELDNWARWGVEGHVKGDKPWIYYNKVSKESLGKLLGAKKDEVVSMNNLTTNLHLLLASFYQPDGKRTKILIEDGAFPSDYFSVESFMKIKGIDPGKNLETIEIPESGYLDNKVICEKIRSLGDSLCVVLLPGAQYYTGQMFDIGAITACAHEAGAFAGFDLAHTIGNLPLSLHDDKVDFATWCSYKYLNSGPGNVSGIFIHENHVGDKQMPRLAGWWGHEEETRFLMKNEFVPPASVDGWQLSNVNILATSAHLASLKMFDEVGMEALRSKSMLLTGFLEFLIKDSEIIKTQLEIISPSNPEERGCQLSLRFNKPGKKFFEGLIKEGIILDWREPDVIRVAPTPFYNRFEEVFVFVRTLESLMK